jgi:hypothetical protein
MEVDPRFYGLHAFKSATESLASLLQTKPAPALVQPEPTTPEVIADTQQEIASLPPALPAQQTIDTSEQNSNFGQLLTNWGQKVNKDEQIEVVREATITQEAVTPEANPIEDVIPKTISIEATIPEAIDIEATSPEAVTPEAVTEELLEPSTSQFIEFDPAQSSNLENLLNPWSKEITPEKTVVTEEPKVEQPKNVVDLDQTKHQIPKEIDLDTQSSFQKNLISSIQIKNDEVKEAVPPQLSSSNWVSKPTLDVQDGADILLPHKVEEKVAKVAAKTEPAIDLFEHNTINFDPRKSNIFNSLPIKIRKQVAQRFKAQLSAQWTARQTIDIDKNTSAFVLEEDKKPDNIADKPQISTANAQAPNLILSPAETIDVDIGNPIDEKSQEEIDSIIEAIKAEGRRMLQKQDEARLSALRQDATMLAAFDDIAADLQKSINSTTTEEQHLIPQEALNKTDKSKIDEQQLLQDQLQEQIAQASEAEDKQRLKDLLEEIELKSYHYTTSFEAKQLGANNSTQDQKAPSNASVETQNEEFNPANIDEEIDGWDLIRVEPLGPGVVRWLGDVVGGVVETGMAAGRVVSQLKDDEPKLLSPTQKTRPKYNTIST